MKIREEKKPFYVIELEEGDNVQVLVPASMERTSVHLTVASGKLHITGGSSIIEEISGEGMSEKVRN